LVAHYFSIFYPNISFSKFTTNLEKPTRDYLVKRTNTILTVPWQGYLS